MPQPEFDVDASIAAGWERFASRLAGLLRDLVPEATFDVSVPVTGTPATRTPYVRFTADAPGSVHAEVSGGGSADHSAPLGPGHLEQLAALGWADGPRPEIRMPVDRASELAHLVAGTLERVFGIPHPVFLHDVTDDQPAGPPKPPPEAPGHDDHDFRPQPIADPDQATRAIESAISEVYGRRVRADHHDVITVRAGCVLLFVRAHRSLPLIVFRSPLVSGVEDAAAAETEVAILNRDSLWCRYVFDGETVSAESEFVDRVFVPVNFKIHLTEVATELDDVYPDLARRVSGRRRRDLRAADDPAEGDK